MKSTWPFIFTAMVSIVLTLILFHFFFQKEPTILAPPDTAKEMELVAKLSKSAVVFVSSANLDQSTDARSLSNYKTGSGVVISQDGIVVTNYHVISGNPNIEVLVDEKFPYKASVIGTDSAHDIALLRIQAAGLAFLPFGDSDSLRVGQPILAIGNPNQLLSSVTSGIVSGLNREYDFPINATRRYLQIDAPTSEGSSGGAVVNVNGQLVGLTVGIISSQKDNTGFAFAMPSNLVQRIVTDIVEHGALVKGSLGMSIRHVSDEIAVQSKLTERYGIIVDAVEVDGAADLAGIQPLDVLLYVNGKKISSIADFQEKWRSYYPGDNLEIIRNRLGVVDTVHMVIQRSKKE